MHKRVYAFLTKHSILHQCQFGFRKKHSTSLALIQLLDSLYSHNWQTRYLDIIFDLQKACDTVDHEVLLYKLYNYGVRGTVYSWFSDYLSNMKQFESLGNHIRTPVIELHRNFDTLPLPQLHQFQLLYFVHKYLHCSSQLPIAFSKYFILNKDILHYNTRSTENLHLTRVSTARSEKCKI